MAADCGADATSMNRRHTQIISMLSVKAMEECIVPFPAGQLTLSSGGGHVERRKRLPLRWRRREQLPFVPQEGIEPPTGGLEGRCSIP